MLEFKIGYELSCISVQILGRRAPESDWLMAEANLQVNSYQAHQEGLLEITDLLEFRNELKTLYDTLTGTATFTPAEGWITIKLDGNGRGQFRLQCCLQSSETARLECNINIDQTYLLQSIQQLDNVLAAYPILSM